MNEPTVIVVSTPDDPCYALVSTEGDPDQAIARIEHLGDFAAEAVRVTPLVDFEEAMS